MEPSFQGFRLQCINPGRLQPLEHKIWAYPAGVVTWELRRFIQELFDDRDKLDINLQLRREKTAWRQHFAELSLPWLRHFLPSQRAVDDLLERRRFGGMADDFEPPEGELDMTYVRAEFSATTEGVVTILLGWAALKRKTTHRQKAEAMLLGILVVCFGGGDSAPFLVDDFIDEVVHECQLDMIDGKCAHVRQVLCSSSCEDSARGDSARCARVLCALFLQRLVCKAAAQAVIAFATALGELAYERLPGMADGDISRWSRLQGPAKKRRADEDYKHHLIIKQVQQNKSSTASSSIASANVARGTGQRWISEQSQMYLARSWGLCAAGCDKVFGLVEDGARFGNPMRETQLYGLWSSAVDGGVWLPPQAVHCWIGC